VTFGCPKGRRWFEKGKRESWNAKKVTNRASKRIRGSKKAGEE